ncbi:MAG: lipoprotein insertase outer membrane protein LolB [Pseudomonadota bacterium]
MKPVAVLCCAIAAVLIVGCQSNPKRADDATIASRDVQLARLKPWRAQGSLVVDSKEQGVINASFNWLARESGFDIRLIGPLGLNTYRITEDTDGARVTGDNRELTGESAEALLLEAIGVRVPLHNMQDWVVGLQGKAASAQRDKQGRIRKMLVTDDDQSRWTVNFERYGKVDALDLPKLILVSGRDVEIRLAIRSWARPEVAAAPVLRPPGTVVN